MGSSARPLHVVIEARLESGRSGGVEGVVAGIAHGLAQLRQGAERYTFVAWEGHEGWLRPHLPATADLLLLDKPEPLAPEPPKRSLLGRVGDALPAARSAWRVIRPVPVSEHVPTEMYDVDPPPLDRRIAAVHPDLIHVPFQHGYLTSIPTIFHPHDLQHVHLPANFDERERSRRDRWYGTLCHQAALVAVASSWTKVDVESHFDLQPDRVRVVPLAPLISAVSNEHVPSLEVVRERHGIPEGYILYPAQTWPHKNHAALLRALAVLGHGGLEIDLVAPGFQNEHFLELEALTESLGLGARVHWLGFVSAAELVTLYQGARGVVIPTLFEAASGPLWEAFRYGVPAACSNVTSLPEQAGDAAIVFDPTDVNAIAAAVESLWSDEDDRRRLIARGRRQVARYSWERTARTFRAHYRKLAGRKLGAEDRDLIQAAPGL